MEVEVTELVDFESWMPRFLQALYDTFPERVWFVGLQGSYGRGEATETSDVDVVVILDTLFPEDIIAYGNMLDTLPYRDLICGFLSGKNELLHWESSDLFQFYYDTTPIKGTLDALLPLLSSDVIDRAIKIGACNIYHSCVHNMLHERSEEALKTLYKAASFVVQAICFKRTGQYFRHQGRLLENASPDERLILQTYAMLKRDETVMLTDMSRALFAWAQKWIVQT